ncbi:short-chain dehydrogenase [Parapedobacter defluvii]|uniref:Short-chain dehydrogenase n=1 Tax=Parapedobacter defluvii TaxID=2045106 RepID=A0ABQ1M2T9_9SPHI|nr:SDR family NAD(P)-dependent oxidoreductase [Parapedobacter defluvii]GGC34024.1 short-chain dehydrogenase [Parapedobacter defluvii]
MEKTYALITGASQGLGKAFVLELAKRKINPILVSLPGEGLAFIADEVKALGMEAHCYETDLTQKENIVALADWVNDRFPLSILINNAGCGGTQSFRNASVDYLDRIIQLNVRATSLLTHQLLPNLSRQKCAYVLNVGSVAAYSPIGYKTVYPASKAFVHSFTRGLYQEFADSNVFFSVVNPGPMMTNSDSCSRLQQQGRFATMGLLSPEQVAAISIRQLFKRDTLIMLNWVNRLTWMVMKFLPIYIRLPLLTNAIKKEISRA